MNEIEFIDLDAQRTFLGGGIEKAISRVLDHGCYIMGPEVAELEESLQIKIGVLGELFGVTRQFAGELLASTEKAVTFSEYPDRGGGIYETKVGNKVARIDQNEERTGYGLGKEWKLYIDDEWHDTYRTMKEAKQGFSDFMKNPERFQ